MGRMPFVDKIYDFADDETKKNLKLACKAFWACHSREKFYKNFTKSQENRHRQLYCYGECANNILFEVNNFLSSLLKNLIRTASSQNFGQQNLAKFVHLTNRDQRTAGLFGLILDGKDLKRANKRRIGVDVLNAGIYFVLKIQNMK